MSAEIVQFKPKQAPRCKNCRYWTDPRGPSGRCLLLSFADAETNSDWLCDDYERDNREEDR